LVCTTDPIVTNGSDKMKNLHLEKNRDHQRRIIVPPPLYVQIAENLLERIESNDLPPGSRLPPERELSETLGVTRATVRQALNVLYDRGLIHRRQGLGTFVASPKIERQAAKLVPFTKGMERRGYKIEIQLVALEKIPSEVILADELAISVGDSVFFVHRVRLLNKEPVLIERLYVPATLFPNLDKFDLAKRSLYEVMEAEYGVVVSKARQSLEPVAATDYEAELLGIKTGAPLMLERRIAYDQNDRPVERARDLFRGDRFRFVTEIAPLEL
jgi:GntR family transcriptional regulator